MVGWVPASLVYIDEVIGYKFAHEMSWHYVTIVFSHYVCEALIQLNPLCDALIYEPRYEKTGFLHMRKQSRRSAVR